MEFSFYTNITCFLVLFSSICLFSAYSVDFITSSQSIKDPDALSSNGFKLGFFSPVNTTNRYVGIWYLNESDVIWVANRNQPLRDSSGVVTISEDGNLVVLNGQKQTLWSSNASNITPNSTAQLLGTGNLVLKDSTAELPIWESFKHPSDTLPTGMKLGSNPRTGKKDKLTSWKSPSDPSTGSFFASLERLDAPEVFIWNGSRPYWRSGPWNGLYFVGVNTNGIVSSNVYLSEGFNIESEKHGTASIMFNLRNRSDFAAFKLNSMGKWSITCWQHQKKAGAWTFPLGDIECSVYGLCGAFGSCDRNSSPVCNCLRGFEPRSLEEWNKNNWTSGCVRKAPLQCESLRNGGEAKQQDGFMKLANMKVPDFAERFDLLEDQCRTQCLENCSCLAYAYDVNIGCMSWSVDLIDMEKFPSGGVDLNIRLSSSEFGILFSC